MGQDPQHYALSEVSSVSSGSLPLADWIYDDGNTTFDSRWFDANQTNDQPHRGRRHRGQRNRLRQSGSKANKESSLCVFFANVTSMSEKAITRLIHMEDVHCIGTVETHHRGLQLRQHANRFRRSGFATLDQSE